MCRSDTAADTAEKNSVGRTEIDIALYRWHNQSGYEPVNLEKNYEGVSWSN